jgi:hypothetical protein
MSPPSEQQDHMEKKFCTVIAPLGTCQIPWEIKFKDKNRYLQLINTLTNVKCSTEYRDG